jgi:uncharacterized protein DUF3592
VTAAVVGVAHHDGEEDPSYGLGGGGWAPVVRFRTEDGRTVEGTSRQVFAGNPRRVPAVGTLLEIRYAPGDPGEVYLWGWGPERSLPAVRVGSAASVVLVGVLFVVVAFVVG